MLIRKSPQGLEALHRASVVPRPQDAAGFLGESLCFHLEGAAQGDDSGLGDLPPGTGPEELADLVRADNHRHRPPVRIVCNSFSL